MDSNPTRTERFRSLPTPVAGFARISQLRALGVPYAESTIWQKVRNNEFPAPIRISRQITAWKVSAITTFLEQLEKTAISDGENRGTQLVKKRRQKRSSAETAAALPHPQRAKSARVARKGK